MTNLFKSRSGIASIIAFIASVVGIFGYAFSPADQELVINGITTIVTLATSIYVAIIRVKESKK